MRTNRPHQPDAAIATAERHEIFPEHTNGIGNVPQILGQAQRMPVLPQHVSSRGVRPRSGQLAQEVHLRFAAINIIQRNFSRYAALCALCVTRIFCVEGTGSQADPVHCGGSIEALLPWHYTKGR